LLLMLAALPSAAAAEGPSFVIVDPAKALPDVRFVDGDGRNRALADFRGKAVLLNVWATWCVPCRKEMPTLDRLQSALGGAYFQVVALSIDRQGLDVVRKFYGEIGVKHLDMHVDSSGKAARELGTVGLPTTLLVDRAGREIGRLVGPAEWDTPEMIAFIRRRIGQQLDRP
jgi:thiol-disulfide isomerase/thioredoxin